MYYKVQFILKLSVRHRKYLLQIKNKIEGTKKMFFSKNKDIKNLLLITRDILCVFTTHNESVEKNDFSLHPNHELTFALSYMHEKVTVRI